MPSSLFPQQIVPKLNPMTQPTPQLINTMQQANQGINNREQVLQLWNVVKTSSNPQQAFEQLLNTNPDFKRAVDTINAMGNPEKLFYEMAKQQGTDPNTVLSLLK